MYRLFHPTDRATDQMLAYLDALLEFDKAREVAASAHPCQRCCTGKPRKAAPVADMDSKLEPKGSVDVRKENPASQRSRFVQMGNGIVLDLNTLAKTLTASEKQYLVSIL